jgi:hypothetical protein
MQPAQPNSSNRSPGAISPDGLLSPFTRTPIGRSYVLSIVVHVLLILLLSVGYIRDNWIDPEGAKIRAEALKAKQIQKSTADPAVPAEEPAPAPAPTASPASPASPAKTDAAKTDREILEERKDTEVGRAISETANPSEIAPGGEGLPLGR